MYLNKKIKEGIFKNMENPKRHWFSAEGQIALFSHRINHLSNHLKKIKRISIQSDHLVKLVGKRRHLLDYLKEKDIERYRSIVKLLGLRK